MNRNTLVLALALLVAGCTTRLGDFTVISSRNVDFDDHYELISTGVEGEDFKQIIIFIPTGTPNIEEAVDQALLREGGDLMTNASLHYSWWWIPFIYMRFGYTVRGDVWRKSDF